MAEEKAELKCGFPTVSLATITDLTKTKILSGFFFNGMNRLRILHGQWTVSTLKAS